MADVQPLHALHYDLDRVGGLQPVVAPPYDVIDAEQRAAPGRPLAATTSSRSTCPQADGDPTPTPTPPSCSATGSARRSSSATTQPALWALAQDYTGPDGNRYTRQGFFARVRVEDYGPGRIRPHERTHPGPKEDRLRLTRATRANLSPIFSLYDDPSGAAWSALAPHTETVPWGEVTDDDGTQHRLWRVGDGGAVAAAVDALAQTELLIADGHHRYETARVYADEIGGEGEHRYVLMCLVALQDPGLTVFPTHRLLTALARRQAPGAARGDPARLGDDGGRRRRPPAHRRDRRPHRARLPRRPPPPPAAASRSRTPAIADAALPDKPEPYRRLDTAVLEALILKQRARHERGRHLPPARARLRARRPPRRASGSRPARRRRRSS